MAGLLGHRDSHLRLIELAFSDSEIIVRGNEISILGESSGMLSRLFEELVLLLRRGEIVDDTVVKRCISMVRDGRARFANKICAAHHLDPPGCGSR